MNTRRIKLGRPGGILLVLLPIWLAFGSWRKITEFLNAAHHSIRDMVDLGFTVFGFVAVTGLVFRKLAVRWEIAGAGEEVVLKRNRRDLFRGNPADLKLLDYDFGMLELETPDGTAFRFPAFGCMKRFLRPDAETLG